MLSFGFSETILWVGWFFQLGLFLCFSNFLFLLITMSKEFWICMHKWKSIQVSSTFLSQKVSYWIKKTYELVKCWDSSLRYWSLRKRNTVLVAEVDVLHVLIVLSAKTWSSSDDTKQQAKHVFWTNLWRTCGRLVSGNCYWQLVFDIVFFTCFASLIIFGFEIAPWFFVCATSLHVCRI